MFLFSSFFSFFKFHEGKIRYGKYVSRVAASYGVEGKERKEIYMYLCLCEGNEKNSVRRIQSRLCKKKLVRVCPASYDRGNKISP